jgi:hypothetical protein
MLFQKALLYNKGKKVTTIKKRFCFFQVLDCFTALVFDCVPFRSNDSLQPVRHGVRQLPEVLDDYVGDPHLPVDLGQVGDRPDVLLGPHVHHVDPAIFIGFRSRGLPGQLMFLMLLVSKKGLIFLWKNDLEPRPGVRTPHCTENSKQIFPDMKLRGLLPNFCFHESVSDFYIPMIGPPIVLYCVCRPMRGKI